MKDKRFIHKVVNKRSFRIKKARRYRQLDTKRDADRRDQRQKSVRAKKKFIKKLKTVSCLHRKYKKWWLGKYCRIQAHSFYRMVVGIELDCKYHAVKLIYDGGECVTLKSNGRWPCKKDLIVSQGG